MREMMEKTCDRISELPDGILDFILSLVPIKDAIRTSTLASRWRNLWKSQWTNATDLDFGEEFAKVQTQEQFVGTVNRYLFLHNSNKINRFRLYFHPGDEYRSEVEKWIKFATLRGVKELDLIFCRGSENYTSEDFGDDKGKYELPGIVFSCGSLIHLNSSHIKLNPSLELTGFSLLQTLRLNQVSITDETLQSLLAKCPLLSNLYLRFCLNLGSIKISSQKLRCLTLLRTDGYEIDIFAPNLKSFHFYGDLYYGYSFRNVSALEDVFISSNGYEFTELEHDYIRILSSVSHIKILTMCIGPPMHVATSEEYNPEALPISLPNLQELQILIGGQIGEEYLGHVFAFFKHTICPCLEKLFIDLSGLYVPIIQPYVEEAEEPSSCIFVNLQIVKINNFRGSDTEMKMVNFFLDKAVVLKSLVIVSAPKPHMEKDVSDSKVGGDAFQSKTYLRTLHDQLLILPKTSKDAQILLFEHWEVDTSALPTHTHTDYYLNDICCN